MKKTKKKLLVIILAAVAVALAILVAASAVLVLGAIIMSGNEFDTGRVVNCGDGVYVIAYDDGQFLQMNSQASRLLFESLETGDRVVILRSSAIALSYPGQCYVKLCFTLSKGTVDNVPEGVMEELQRIGWID